MNYTNLTQEGARSHDPEEVGIFWVTCSTCDTLNHVFCLWYWYFWFIILFWHPIWPIVPKRNTYNISANSFLSHNFIFVFGATPLYVISIMYPPSSHVTTRSSFYSREGCCCRCWSILMWVDNWKKGVLYILVSVPLFLKGLQDVLGIVTGKIIHVYRDKYLCSSSHTDLV